MAANTSEKSQELSDLSDWVYVDTRPADAQSFHSALSEQPTAATPLLASSKSRVLTDYDFKQNILDIGCRQELSGALVTPHGIRIATSGLDVPGFSPGPLAWGIVGFVVAALSGASGYMGGYDALGIPGGIGSWLATSALNLDGVIQLIIWWIESAGVPCSFGLILTIFTAVFLAAAPPAVLAAQGALKTCFGPDALKQMTTTKYGVAAFFGACNLGVSGALNTRSFLNFPKGLTQYFGRLAGRSGVWSNIWIDRMARVFMGLLLYPTVILTMLATVARGHATERFAEDFLHHMAGLSSEHAAMGAKGIFVSTALPGFAMFLYGMLQLTLFVEKIIHFIIVKFPQRVTKVVWSDPLIKGIAIGIAILFATFTMINYQGLGEKTYTDDWWLGRLIPDILRVLLGIQRENAASTFEFMVMIAPGINLLQRSVNFANYMSALYRYKLSHPVTEGERVQELIAAGEIFAAYRRCYPKSEEELSTWLFDQNKVNYDEYPVVSNK